MLQDIPLQGHPQTTGVDVLHAPDSGEGFEGAAHPALAQRALPHKGGCLPHHLGCGSAGEAPVPLPSAMAGDQELHSAGSPAGSARSWVPFSRWPLPV